MAPRIFGADDLAPDADNLKAPETPGTPKTLVGNVFKIKRRRLTRNYDIVDAVSPRRTRSSDAGATARLKRRQRRLTSRCMASPSPPAPFPYTNPYPPWRNAGTYLRPHPRSRPLARPILASFPLSIWIITFLFISTSALPPLRVAIAPEGRCRLPLGMESGEIPDSALTASSTYDPHSVGAKHSRIRIEGAGGAWCPRHQITKSSYEWVQVDFDKLTIVTLVETQGRFGNGQGQEFADFYRLEYRREANGTWIHYRNRRGEEVLQGNLNTYIAELRELDPFIIVSSLRFVPHSSFPRTICMRIEIYGCPWRDGLVSYSMPEGDRRGEVDFHDFTYDGVKNRGMLYKGLGQLADGEYGQDNFRLDLRGRGLKGYEWIGWKNETTLVDKTKDKSLKSNFITESPPNSPIASKKGRDPIPLVFEFDSFRNFTHVIFHCNNLYTKDVQVFSTATVWFSDDGKYYSDPPIVYRYMSDIVMELARPVYIRLNGRVGKFVKVELTFEARWIMISEVTFQSVPVKIDPTVERDKKKMEEKKKLLKTMKPTDVKIGKAKTDENEATLKEVAPTVPSKPFQIKQGSEAPPPSNDEPLKLGRLASDYLGLVVGLLAGLMLLLALCIAAVVWKIKRQNPDGKKNVKIDLSELRAGLNKRSSYPNLYGNLVGSTDSDSSSDYPIYKAASTLSGGYHPAAIPPPILEGQFAGHHLAGCNGIYCDPWDQQSRLQMIRRTIASDSEGSKRFSNEFKSPEGSLLGTLRSNPFNQYPETCSNRDYAVPDVAKPYYQTHLYGAACGLPVSVPVPAGGTLPMAMRGGMQLPTFGAPQQQHLPAPVETPYNVTEIIKATHIQGVSGNTVYAAPPNIDLLKSDADEEDTTLKEFPRNALKFEEKLGEGQFGEVHLCEVKDLVEIIGTEMFEELDRPESVAVKTLREGATQNARDDFYKEMKIIGRLSDPNIIRVLGVCTEREPLFMIVEYMKYGDLNQFLQRHVPESNIAKMTNADCLSFNTLMYMAGQIASGMKYLESLNLVHRDLATRNCLVGAGFTIKVSDFGMSRSLYSSDYYRLEGSAVLPIRWMAWESVLMGKFTCKTDVWAFGITLWEILTLAKEQPFVHLSDDEVVENLRHLCFGTGRQAYLPQPLNCPPTLYDAMLRCWSREDIQRPTFAEIYSFIDKTS